MIERKKIVSWKVYNQTNALNERITNTLKG